jgi:hypothetical protein
MKLHSRALNLDSLHNTACSLRWSATKILMAFLMLRAAIGAPPQRS